MAQHTDLPSIEVEQPLLPLRDVVVFPQMVVPLFVGRPKSIGALEAARENNTYVMLVAQKNAAKDDPTEEDLYKIGSLATVLQILKLPDGTVKALVEGVQRAQLITVEEKEACFVAQVNPIASSSDINTEAEAMRRTLLVQFEQYVKLNKKIPAEVVSSMANIESAGQLADLIAAHLPLKIGQKQAILEIIELKSRLDYLLKLLEAELDILQVEKRIRNRVKRQLEKSQREYYLNEQVKAIQKELGELEEGADLEELDKKIKNSGMTKEAREKIEGELKKLRMMSPMSAEASVVRNYIDILLGLPWKKHTKVRKSLPEAEEILEADHYGLERVKERIVEYLAVQNRVNKIKAPILCLVGPPGVGKTSLGKSIARATNRKFIRAALGGVRDEAEIRGHRRTYIGAMPGKILQSMAKVEVKNPLFLLDEVDKMGADFRGDPSSALLEVLDPEQNMAFADHYVEVEYDLSDVMFVATANTLNIPPALLDRMEVIRLSGYTEDEKINIAHKYLVPKQLQANGLKESELLIQESALRNIVRYYTREAGVRSLEREIAKICRKVVKALLIKPSDKKIVVSSKGIEKYLGVYKYDYGQIAESNQIGQVNGLAWTEAGGELLTIEATLLPGQGKMIATGKLGEVMQESGQAALSVVRSRAQRLGIPTDFYQKSDIHIHFPEGATPKDGPSAGIAIVTALVSVLTKIPVRSDIAMTGEITLRGEVLPIGGLKEKLLAAHRSGIKQVLIPQKNIKDLTEIPDNIKHKLQINPVKWIDEVLALALERQPELIEDNTNLEGAAIIKPISEKKSAQTVKH